MTKQGESVSEPASGGIRAPADRPVEGVTRGVPIEAGIMAATAKGGAVAVLGQAVSLGTTLVTAAILARLLGPEEYGLVGMVTVVTGLLLVANDTGMVLATIQKPELDDESINGAFYLQVVASCVVTLFALAFAPALGWFYDEPRVVRITLALSPSFLLIGLYSQHHALMRRNLRFGTVTVISVAAMSVASVVAILVACSGGGYWALVAQSLAHHFTTAACSWAACSWRPGYPSIAGVRAHVRFGTPFMAYKFFDYVFQSSDRLLLGWVHGAGPLGLYTRGFSLLTVPMAQLTAPLTQVLVPALSRLQADEVGFRSMFTKALNLVAWAMLPIGTVMLIGADELVLLLLGPDWVEAGRILTFASAVVLALPMSTAFSWLLVPLGRTPVMLRWGVIAAVVVTSVAAASLPFGARGVAAARGACALGLGILGLAYAVRGTAVRARHLWVALRWPMLSAVASVVLVPLFVTSVPFDSAVHRLLAITALVAAGNATMLVGTGELRTVVTVGRLLLVRKG